MNFDVRSISGKKFKQQEINTIKDTLKSMNVFFLREFVKTKSFDVFVNEMEKLEIFEWLEDIKKMRYSYNSDIVIDIDLLPLFRDYKIEQILKK